MVAPRQSHVLGYSSIVVFTVWVFTITGCDCLDGDACRTATNMAESWRDVTKAPHDQAGHCDTNTFLPDRWYSFQIGNESAMIPITCVQNNMCGATIGLRIELEGKLLPEEGENITAYLCGSYNVLGRYDCCVLRTLVTIAKCKSNKYVYRFHTPIDRCPAAVCTQKTVESVPPHAKAIMGEPHPHPNLLNNGDNSNSNSNNSDFSQPLPPDDKLDDTIPAWDDEEDKVQDDSMMIQEDVPLQDSADNSTADSGNIDSLSAFASMFDFNNTSDGNSDAAISTADTSSTNNAQNSESRTPGNTNPETSTDIASDQADANTTSDTPSSTGALRPLTASSSNQSQGSAPSTAIPKTDNGIMLSTQNDPNKDAQTQTNGTQLTTTTASTNKGGNSNSLNTSTTKIASETPAQVNATILNTSSASTTPATTASTPSTPSSFASESTTDSATTPAPITTTTTPTTTTATTTANTPSTTPMTSEASSSSTAPSLSVSSTPSSTASSTASSSSTLSSVSSSPSTNRSASSPPSSSSSSPSAPLLPSSVPSTMAYTQGMPITEASVQESSHDLTMTEKVRLVFMGAYWETSFGQQVIIFLELFLNDATARMTAEAEGRELDLWFTVSFLEVAVDFSNESTHLDLKVSHAWPEEILKLFEREDLTQFLYKKGNYSLILACHPSNCMIDYETFTTAASPSSQAPSTFDKNVPVLVAVTSICAFCLVVLVIGIICAKCRRRRSWDAGNDVDKTPTLKDHNRPYCDGTPSPFTDTQIMSDEDAPDGSANGSAVDGGDTTQENSWVVPLDDFELEEKPKEVVAETTEDTKF